MAENPSRERERDLVLNPRQYAYILDLTKGQVSVYVGPLKTSLSDTDRPVRVRKMDTAGTSPIFEQCRLEDSIQEFPSADEGGYIVLENPNADKEGEHPGTGANTMTASGRWRDDRQRTAQVRRGEENFHRRSSTADYGPQAATATRLEHLRDAVGRVPCKCR